MPLIRPISDLRNYPEVVSEVHEDQPVYLTKNGSGAYAIIDIATLNKMERMKAELEFLKMMFQAEQDSNEKGWLTREEFKNKLGISK